MRICWATVNSNGTLLSSGGAITISPHNLGSGQYVTSLPYNSMPSIVGCQTRLGNTSEANTDGIVFPFLSATSATAITGNNNGTPDDRSFSFIAAGETATPVGPLLNPSLILWGVITADGTIASSSGGFTIPKPTQAGQYVINFTTPFTTVPAIVATQTNSNNLTEANTDGIVIPILSNTSATLITGNNKSTQESRNFCFIAVGDGNPGIQQVNPFQLDHYVVLWGSINANGTIAGGSGGFSVGRQGPGMYVITFPSFATIPAIVGTQTGAGSLSEDNREGMVFPWLNTNYAVAITGDASGNQQDRSFSFIVFGKAVPVNT